MRLTNVSQMQVQPGRLFSYAVIARAPGLPGGTPTSERLPVSFDQNRHVSAGSRPGSWMAVSFQLPAEADREQLAHSWHAVLARHGTLRSAFSWKQQNHDDDAGAASAEELRCGGPETELELTVVEIEPGQWEELAPPAAPRAAAGFTAPAPPPQLTDPAERVRHAEALDHGKTQGGTQTRGGADILSSAEIREALRAHFDVVCDPFAAPSYRLCVIEDPAGRRAPQVIIGSDHSHIDAWSLLVLIRDLTAILEDLQAGRQPGEQLPPAQDFAAHTRSLEQRPFPPAEVVTRWREILGSDGRSMPRFPLDLGDIASGAEEVVEIRDVFDAGELARIEAYAAEHKVRLIAVAVSVMTRLARQLSGGPLRTVFPVHSRDDPSWFDSVGWFITNSVLENDDEDYAACYAAVKEAAGLGSYPLAPIMRPYGGMPQDPGMFAMSWLDHRKLPVNVPEHLNPQHISAVIRTDGVMIWFVINESGMHLRCRYPDTLRARGAMRTWLAGLVYGLRSPLERQALGFPDPHARPAAGRVS